MKYRCPIKRNAHYGVKYVWVPKEIIANTQGQKNVWVPKTWDFLCKVWKRRIINGTWTVATQGIWLQIIHVSQVLPRQKMVKMFPLEITQKEKFSVLVMSVKFPKL